MKDGSVTSTVTVRVLTCVGAEGADKCVGIRFLLLIQNVHRQPKHTFQIQCRPMYHYSSVRYSEYHNLEYKKYILVHASISLYGAHSI